MNTAKSSVALAALVVLLGFASVAYPQTSGGRISGAITDPTGATVPNARISVKNTATQAKRDVTASSDGLYSIPNLVPGSYELLVTATGFKTIVRPSLTVEVGSELVINVELSVGEVSEQVLVTSDTPNVELATSAISNVVNEKTVVELPLNGRDWTSLATLQPGVATARTQSPVSISNQRPNRGLGTQLTIEGNRPQQNNYRLDGISINDYSNGGPGSVVGVDLGVDAIREFSVVTSNASAEYGKSSGGIINASSRTGSNNFHGSAYEFHRNSALDARNFFDGATVPPFKRNQFGFAAGGPIWRDRTFIFGDYEGLRQNLAVNFVSSVPSDAARAGQLTSGTVTVDPLVTPYLALYPRTNGAVNGDTGLFSFAGQQVTKENYFTLRADHKISKSDSIFGTYMFDNGNSRSPDTFNNKNIATLSERRLYTVEENHVFSSNLVNAARFGFSRVVSLAPVTLDAINPAASNTALGFVPGLAVGLINISGIANFQGGLGAVGEFDFRFNDIQFYDDVFYTKGSHSLKFGAVVERLQADQLGKANPNGQYIFGSLANFLTNKPTSFNAPLSTGVSPRNLRQNIFGSYLQDDWKLRPNLTLNLGLRYELAGVPTEVGNKLSVLANITDAAPKIGAPYFNNPTKHNFAPRVGFAWDPFRNGKTSVRGAFGIYDVLPLTYQFQLLSIFAADFDIRHNLVVSYLWQIPIAKSLSGPLGVIAKGWQLGGILQSSSGFPFTAAIGGDSLGLRSADTFGFPNRVSSADCANPVNPGNPTHYIKTECFTAPPLGTLGNGGRNTLIGPHLNNFDMSLVKNTPVKWISETFNVQFRMEVFNIFNHTNFAQPTNANRQIFNSALARSSSAGTLTGTATTSRQIQFALKLNW